jgi:hypothetical protein
MSTWIQADGTIEEVQPNNGSTYSLKELHAFVGGYIELVYLPDGRLMVLNEEGKMNDLPFNSLATALYNPHSAFQDYIVGDVLVCQQNEIE